eukprot:9214434-Pyramimonas_sp.AAC.1
MAPNHRRRRGHQGGQGQRVVGRSREEKCKGEAPDGRREARRPGWSKGPPTTELLPEAKRWA